MWDIGWPTVIVFFLGEGGECCFFDIGSYFLDLVFPVLCIPSISTSGYQALASTCINF